MTDHLQHVWQLGADGVARCAEQGCTAQPTEVETAELLHGARGRRDALRDPRRLVTDVSGRLDVRYVLAALVAALFLGVFLVQFAVRLAAPAAPVPPPTPPQAATTVDAGLVAWVAIIAALIAAGVAAVAGWMIARAERAERERAWLRDRSADFLRIAEHVVWEAVRWVRGGVEFPGADAEDLAAQSIMLYASAPTGRLGDAAERVYDAVGGVVSSAVALKASGAGESDPGWVNALENWHDSRKAMIDALRVEMGRAANHRSGEPIG